MKKVLVWVCAALLLMALCTASAEDGFIGEMTVVNCEEWVSLRESPSTSSERLAKIPLGATVENCAWYSSDFIYCEYEGVAGYVLADYLCAADAAPQMAGNALCTIGDCTVAASRDYSDGGEELNIVCVDGQGRQIWSRTLRVDWVTELDSTDAFAGGTAERPLVLAYNASEGLHALDFFTGEELWLLPRETVDLGGSLTHAVAEDGTMYIGGYYGPDPVAISADGEVLWEAVSKEDFFWLYDIQIEEDVIRATYDGDSGALGYGGAACYDLVTGEEKEARLRQSVNDPME